MERRKQEHDKMLVAADKSWLEKCVDDLNDKGDEKRINKTLVELKGLLRGNVREQRKFINFGGPTLVVQCMARHPLSSRIQLHAIQVVAASEKLLERVGEVGGIQAIIKAMAMFPTNKVIMGHALGASLRLIRSNHPDNAQKFVQGTNGLSIIVNATNDFHGDTEIARVSFAIVECLAANETLWCFLFSHSCNVLTMLATVRDSYKNNHDINRACARIMSYYTKHHEQNY